MREAIGIPRYIRSRGYRWVHAYNLFGLPRGVKIDIITQLQVSATKLPVGGVAPPNRENDNRFQPTDPRPQALLRRRYSANPNARAHFGARPLGKARRVSQRWP